MAKLLKNKYARWVAILLVGITIGAVFYPTKTITREEKSKYEQQISKLTEEKKEIQENHELKLQVKESELKSLKSETQNKISSLKTENTKLKRKVKETRVKIVRPDGTIVEKSVLESDTEIVSQIVTDIKQEFTQKVTSIENKWKSIHEKRLLQVKSKFDKKIAEQEKTIVELSKKEKIEINKKSFGLSLGITENGDYTGSVLYDVWGPVFLDLHAELDNATKNKELGIGIGIRF